PEPHPLWSGTLDATRPASECPQINFRGQVKGSEDCLYLNIYTPDPPGSGLPVMVWIHGGTFLIGSGAQYDGSRLAAKGNLVVVTINYRLGPLGFLAHPALDAENLRHISGNYGLLDQQAALRWVRENISGFGGDPKNVTVAGESAGAISVGVQMVSPGAKGFFERAIMESGPFLPKRTLKQAEAQGIYFADKLGYDKVTDAANCMRSKNIAEILRAIPASPTGRLVWAPVIDGDVVPSQVIEAFSSGRFNKVPVINGSNHNEGTLFLAFASPISAGQYQAGLNKRFGGNADNMLAAYPLKLYTSAAQAAAAQVGDGIFSCPIIGASAILSKSVPVYAYEFNDQHAPTAPWLPEASFPYGAYHGSEIQYLFGNGKALSAGQRKLSDDMIGYWTGFIRSGDPGTHSPRWTAYSPGAANVLSLAPGAIAYESDFSKVHHCAVWQSLHC
ncbi:MAG TPA: carboxylesterase family protein, partial [Candidatus Binataceae bacterium]|nr:carboxylesterase family protein [Candidatus Binataceae bacterium]